MNKVITLGAIRHKQFELEVKAKEHHKLDLNEYKNINNKSDKNYEIISKLKKINDLYNSGILTEDEFKKAKSKILN